MPQRVSGTRGVVRLWHAVERSRLPPQAGAGKRDSLVRQVGEGNVAKFILLGLSQPGRDEQQDTRDRRDL